MKKKILVICLTILLLLTGCGNKSEKDLYNKVRNNIKNCKNYHLSGILEIMNNETVYTYDVDVSYAKNDKFKVSLKNQTNGHEQIVLRNDEGVYVITPSLNKSFKFQSEWPYNNSQAYLLQTIITDLENDSGRKFSEEKDNYIFTSKVNYVNNKNLVSQKVYINKDNKVDKVEVLDSAGNIKIAMKFKSIDMKATFNSDYFDLENNVINNVSEETKTSNINDIIYPMYIPLNTNLSNQETVKTSDGERVILTFSGDNSFMFIQENTKPNKTMQIIPINGEPVILGDSIGALTGYSINWYSNNKEYYIASSALKSSELIEVAKSVSSIPVVK